MARAARERSEQERETTGFGAPAVFNPRTFLAVRSSDLPFGRVETGQEHDRA